jgi:ribosomal-protein-alanine acetyltransferase
MAMSELKWMSVQEREIFGAAAWSLALVTDDFAYGGKRYRVIELDGVLVAYAVYGYDGDAFSLMNIAVIESSRGQGHARVLMRDFLAEAHSEQARDAWLEVAVTNQPALALYRSFGFEDVRIRPRYYQPEDVDAMVMRVSVQPSFASAPAE